MKTPVIASACESRTAGETLDCFVACAPRNDGEEHYRGCWEPDGIGGGAGERGGKRQAPALRPAIIQ